MMRRRIPLYAFLGTIIFVLAISGYVVYLVMFSSEPEQTTEEGAPEGEPIFGTDQGEPRSLRPTSTEQDPSFFSEERRERLWQVTDRPIAAAVVIEREVAEDELRPRIRYIERATGHIYEADPDRGTLVQLTTARIPRIQWARFIGDGDAVVLQYLDSDGITVESFLAQIARPAASAADASDPPNQGRQYWNFNGRFLPPNILALAASPSGDDLLYLLATESGSRGVRMSVENGDTSELFRHAMRELQVDWPTEGQIALTTRSSRQSNGVLFRVDPDSGDVRVTLSGVPALNTKTSPDGSALLYFSYAEGVPTLSVYWPAEARSRQLALATLPEKCAWDPENTDVVYCAVPTSVSGSDYPDDWYKGTRHYQDNIWQINLRTEQTDLLVSALDFDGDYDLDAVDLSIDPRARYLLFRNNADLSLWRVRLDGSASGSGSRAPI